MSPITGAFSLYLVQTLLAMKNQEQLGAVQLPESHTKTYALSRSEKSGQEQIMCLNCGRVSHNPNDVISKYCGHCHFFHED